MTRSQINQTPGHSRRRDKSRGIVACIRIATVTALVVIGGCGGSDADALPPGGTYSCRAMFPGTDMLALCIEASGGTGQDLENNRQQCTAQGNTFASEPCPLAGALGGCRQTVAAAGAVITTWYYADGTATADDIQMLCEGLAGVAPAGVTIQFVLP
jgi:hypothetical protein